MRNGFVLFATVLALLLTALLPAAAAAGGAARTHDGLFLRLSGGAGTANSSIEIEAMGAKIELSGSAVDMNFAIGGMVAPNLAVHGTLWGWSMEEPDLEITIPGYGSESGRVSGTAMMTAIGAGVTYYFMPVNMYASGSVGIGTLEFTEDNESKTDSGPALDLTVGKEWWVGNSWGLGLAGGFSYHSLPEKDVDENWSGTSFALRFSATFN
jgi:hypothetical protein